MTLFAFTVALEQTGFHLADFRDIYDFGCGCGRVMRWLATKSKGARLHGSDIDEPAIDWLRENLPQVDARVNQGLPPLSFASGAFDLVLGYSVFSHLDEHYQDAWLAELHRVTRPGGVLLLTVHGKYNWDYSKAHVMSNLPNIAVLDSTLTDRNFLYWTGDGWEQHFPNYYHTAWHLPQYIREHWSYWFEVVDIVDHGARPTRSKAKVKPAEAV